MKKLFAVIRSKFITRVLMRDAMKELGKQIIKDGNALESLIKLKVIEDSASILKGEIIKAAIKEAKASGDKDAIQGISYYVNKSPKQYTFDKDEAWGKMSAQLSKLKARMKKREKVLIDGKFAVVKNRGKQFVAFNIS